MFVSHHFDELDFRAMVLICPNAKFDKRMERNLDSHKLLETSSDHQASGQDTGNCTT